jgi:hypothetical protein
MPILWLETPDRLREQAHRSRVARAVQPVEHAIGARGREQGTDVGFLARLWDRWFRQHGRHGAPSPWRLSSEIRSETLGEGGGR